MTKKYMFAVEEMDDDTGNVISTKVHTFTIESGIWGGFDGPMENFFMFLKGEGFCFHLNEEIGVMNNDTGVFRGVHQWE